MGCAAARVQAKGMPGWRSQQARRNVSPPGAPDSVERGGIRSRYDDHRARPWSRTLLNQQRVSLAAHCAVLGLSDRSRQRDADPPAPNWSGEPRTGLMPGSAVPTVSDARGPPTRRTDPVRRDEVGSNNRGPGARPPRGCRQCRPRRSPQAFANRLNRHVQLLPLRV